MDERGAGRERASRFGAGQSTEVSDAKSEGLQEDRVGRRLSLGPLAERQRHCLRRVEQQGQHQHLDQMGKVGVATLAISNDCDVSVACCRQSTGAAESMPSHGVADAIVSLIRSAPAAPGQA
ncbi:MAG: hypothetical protein M3Z15_07455 [Pseudomonadota bacterium]|nr:hypothetical protein [Pseudomonadota bacterium]